MKRHIGQKLKNIFLRFFKSAIGKRLLKELLHHFIDRMIYETRLKGTHSDYIRETVINTLIGMREEKTDKFLDEYLS